MQVDITILGGGLIGATFANLLAETTDYSILLVEPRIPKLTWNSDNYDIRVSAISRSSQNIFSKIGIWDDILQHRTGYYRDMQVWDGATDAEIYFSAEEFGENDLGHIIENRIIHGILWHKLRQHKNIKIISTKAKQMLPHNNYQELILDRAIENKIETKLVVGADGANSWLRQYQRIEVSPVEVGHHALVATIETARAHNSVARQCFTPDGPLAFLPLDNPYFSSIVWSSSPELTKNRMELSEQEFCAQLDRVFALKLGRSKLNGIRACFPIKPFHANSYIGKRTVLIGDAAHVVHPLAGQGLNLGIKDAAVLAELLKQHGLGKTSIGLRKVLRKYERSRRGENAVMLYSGLGFKKLFGSDFSIVKKIRSSGLQFSNQFKELKQFLAFKAMGKNI